MRTIAIHELTDCVCFVIIASVMRSNRALMALGLALMWAFAAQADETLISGAIRVGAYDVEV